MNTRDRTRVSSSIAWILSLALLAACGPAQDGGDAGGTITILSPHHDDIKKVFEDAFSAYHQEEYGEPAHLQFRDIGGTGTLLQYIDSEYSRNPDTIGVDILFGGGTEPFLKLQEEGRLEPHKIPDDILDRIPESFGGLPVYADDHSWYGAALSGFGLMYNKRVLEIEGLSAPETWEDLTRPALFNRVGSADPRRSGSTHMCYEIMLQVYGWEKGWDIITRTAANVRGFTASGSDVPRDVATGDAAVGMVIDLYAWAELAQTGEERLGFVFPKGLTVVNPDGIAIFKGAPNRVLAERFVEFAMSPAGQKLWMLPADSPEFPGDNPLFRMSVMPSLYEEMAEQRTVAVNPYDLEITFEFDAELSKRRYDLLNDLLDAFVITPHDDLQKAWQAIVAADMPEDALNELTAMPMGLEEALQVLAETEGDSVRREKVKTQWQQAAKEKYRRAAQLAKS